MLQANDEYARLSYYIENYEDGYRLREAEDTVERLKGRNQSTARLGLGCGLGLAVFVLWGLISAGTNLTTGFLFIVFIGVPAFVGLYAWQGRSKYDQARQVVADLDDQIDQELFGEVDDQVQGSVPSAKKTAAARKRIVDRFFAGKALEKPDTVENPGAAVLPAVAAAGAAITSDSRDLPLNNPEAPLEIAPGKAADKPSAEPLVLAVPVAPFTRPPIKFCALCGANVIQPEAKFCSVCGEELLH